MKPLPSNFHLAAEAVKYCDELFDVYAVEDDGEYAGCAVCVHGKTADLTEILADSVVAHFDKIAADWDPRAEDRHERAMERVGAALLGCGIA